jgi:hypothetical protein
MEKSLELMNEYKPAIEWTDHDWELFTGWLSGALKNFVVTVTFIKKDGSERVMRCTLLKDLLPKETVKEDTIVKPKKKSENTLSVYDLDVEGWRSFTIKSVKQVRFSIE